MACFTSCLVQRQDVSPMSPERSVTNMVSLPSGQLENGTPGGGEETEPFGARWEGGGEVSDKSLESKAVRGSAPSRSQRSRSGWKKRAPTEAIGCILAPPEGQNGNPC